jgi:P27 family predicted phage terminase small subunit
VVKELDAAGVLATADRDALAAYCSCVADVEELTKLIDADGLMVDTPTVDRNGELTGDTVRKPHPALKWRSDLLLKVKQFAAEFGLTPASRSRVSGQPAPAEAEGNRVLAIRDRIQAARANRGG